MTKPIQEIQKCIHILGDDNVYYLECGPHQTPSLSLSRVIGALVQQGKLKMGENPTRYEIINIEEAKKKQFKLIPIYLNSHIRRIVEEQSKEISSSWGSLE